VVAVGLAHRVHALVLVGVGIGELVLLLLAEGH
jgi:hypothetical protein